MCPFFSFIFIYSSSLQDRVRWLEEIVKTRCSDVDLKQGPMNLVGRQTSAHDGVSINIVTTSPQTHQGWIVDEPQRENLAHEIGLVSVTAGQDPRYVGPSSGYSFAKLVLASAGQRHQQDEYSRTQRFHASSMLDKEIFRVPPAKMPSNMEHSVQLSAAYWDDVHFLYPFLHRPTHMKLLEHMHNSECPNPVAAFQVHMVLAISTTILSRRLKAPLSAEGYCTAALTYFEKIQIEGSLDGLQCLLLLQVYGLNNPSMGLNVWYLNYQCIASVLDLGLQRDVRAGKSLSMLTQEMRTRIFWVVYSLDRTLATIMGRPIGLRDEACELRVSVTSPACEQLLSLSTTAPAGYR
jgi:Fungal specific transcription factor domain